MSASLRATLGHTHSFADVIAGGGTFPLTSLPASLPLSHLSALRDYMKTFKAANTPAGTVAMWSGTLPPQGWVECTGENGTPDMRGYFPRCISDIRGGVAEVVVSSAHVRGHTHTGTTSSMSHDHTIPTWTAGTVTSSSSGDHNHGGATLDGGSHAHACPVTHGNTGTAMWRAEYGGWKDAPFDTGRRTSTEGAHSHTLAASGAHTHLVNISHSHTSTAHSHSHSITISAPSGAPSSVSLGAPRPLYHALMFIMKMPAVSLLIVRPLSLGTSSDMHHLHISEVEVFSKSSSPLSLSLADPAVNQMGTVAGAGPERTIDGNTSTNHHSNYGAGVAYGSETHFLHLLINNISSAAEVGTIKVHHNVSSGAQHRLVGATIQVLEEGEVMWSSTFATVGTLYTFTVG